MNDRTSTEITQLLKKCAQGDKLAEEQLFQNVYAQLKKLARSALARETPNHSLSPTALVNEAFLRIPRRDFGWQDRTHFYAVCARAMRRILVDHAREKAAHKRPNDLKRVDLGDAAPFLASAEDDPESLLAIDLALQELARFDPQLSLIVELRFFGGMTEGEIADFLHCSTRTVRRYWQVARVWLHRELSSQSEPK